MVIVLNIRSPRPIYSSMPQPLARLHRQRASWWKLDLLGRPARRDAHGCLNPCQSIHDALDRPQLGPEPGVGGHVGPVRGPLLDACREDRIVVEP